MPNFQNSLVWSTTRITVLEYCNRKYFFNYYTNYLKDISQDIWLEGLLLKHLKSLDMRVGEKTHNLLSDYLRLLKYEKANDNNLQDIRLKIQQEMKDEFLISKNRDYNNYDKTHKFGLSEHYYGLSIDDKLPSSIKKVFDNLDAFIQSERNEKVQQYFKIAKTIYIEDPRHQDFENMKVKIHDMPELKDITIMAGPDFGVIFDSKKYLIIDRKSGKEKIDLEGVSDQIKIYGLKFLSKQGLNADDIELYGYEVFLPSLNKFGGKISHSDISSIKQKLLDDVSFQKQFLVDQDPISNIPLGHKNFPKTRSSKKCETCTFRKLCEKLEN